MSKNRTIIDVRSKSEFDEGHIEGAINWDADADQPLPELDKSAPIGLYCVSGGRAGRAKQAMESQGYTDVNNCGGLNDMVASGLGI